MHEKLKRQLEESRYLRKPMKPCMEDSAEQRWLQKPVMAVRKLDLLAMYSDLRLEGPGLLKKKTGKGQNGETVVCVDFPTEQPVQNPSGRAYALTKLTIPLPHEDLSAYTRLTVDIYIDSENSGINEVELHLYNQGPVEIPVPGRFEGFHSAMVGPGKWTRLLWEIPHLCRVDVTGISVSFLEAGVSYPGEKRVCAYVNNVCFERVEPDQYKGFDLRKDSFAYCHSGYLAGARKQALVQGHAGHFELTDEQGNTVWQGESKPLEHEFVLLDFTEVKQEGWYRLRMGDITSGTFPIGAEAYLSCAWKSLNFFLAERCGYSVPNAHSECHLDVMSKHPDGRMKCVAGGWHDAGDLTQDGRNTMECVLAMLETAQAAAGKQQALADRALEEARWGLDWMMRIRWGDGYRHCGRIIAFWTDNALGTTDDVTTMAENRPYDNLLSAQVFARAAQVLKDEDAMYAKLCARMAKEDFLFGTEWVGKAKAQSFSFATQLQLSAQAALSGAELYRLTEDEVYLDAAARAARIVMNCQQKEPIPDFRLPIYGYFYEEENHWREQAYFHRSYEHVPLHALCDLLELAPEHPDAALWEKSLQAYAHYLKQMTQFTPYELLAAGVYRLDAADFTNIYHEGDRSKGAPSMEEYNAQVRNGIQLDNTHYVRIFPVAYQFRGYHAIHLSKALAAVRMGDILHDQELRNIAYRQMEWVLGMNPFAVSGQYGEGYDYHPLYTGLQPQIVGALPVGFESFENEDIPYYPLQAIATYKEIWVHTTCRILKCAAYFGFSKEDSNRG